MDSRCYKQPAIIFNRTDSKAIFRKSSSNRELFPTNPNAEFHEKASKFAPALFVVLKTLIRLSGFRGCRNYLFIFIKRGTLGIQD